jgi:hypothetical protein
MFVPEELLAKAQRWEELKRWERRELGQALRQLGLSYREIREIIPVPRGTLSGWCRDIELTPEQAERIERNRKDQYLRLLVGKRRRTKRLDEIAAIRNAGQVEGRTLAADPDWVAGVVAYWAEGSKRDNELGFSNSDPEMIALFISWARRYLALEIDRFTISLHLHSGQDETERKTFWSNVTGLSMGQFRKTYIKPEGTGHRKNILYNGTASIRVTRSTDLFHRVTGWMAAVRESLPFS